MLRMNVLHAAVLGAVFALFTGCMQGGEGTMPRNQLPSPEETVRAYCALDAAGARLLSESWSQVLPYISWPEEAGVDRAIIIGGFSIAATRKRSQSEAEVTVAYDVLGVLEGEYRSRRETERVVFDVRMTDRGWKIVSPEGLPPHVLARDMVKHLEGTKQLEQSEAVRKDAQ